jgi:hypothetical protein
MVSWKISLMRTEGLRGARVQAPQSIGQWEQWFSFSWSLTEDKLPQRPLADRRAGDPGVAGAGETVPSGRGAAGGRARRIG